MAALRNLAIGALQAGCHDTAEATRWASRYMMNNGGWQPIDPSDMQPGTRPETHIPLLPGYWG
jgi:hypothetical protein